MTQTQRGPGPSTTVRGQAKARRRQDLLAASATLFAERGFAGVSIDDIGAAAGVSGPAVYRHFPSKQAVLGAILLTEQALDGVLLEIGLRSDHFYRPRHQRIFQAMIRLKEKADPEAVDALTVCDDLRANGALDEAGGEAYVHSLPTVVPAVGAVLDYARIVRDDALMRAPAPVGS